MRKVVYNACYGGFSLSKKAVLMGRDLSGDNRWMGCTLAGEKYDDGSTARGGFGNIEGYHVDHNAARHDPILVKVVEDLGPEASGDLANLLIAEVDGKYRIDEYDGFESVETPDSYDWVD